jgi:hypothetical protein
MAPKLDGAEAMVLTKAIVRDPPAARRFRYIAPVLVMLGLALLAMAPGILVHLSDAPGESFQELIDHLVLDARG